jgi:hypothetical protein
MFGVNWSDPQTLWLNITNLALGLITLAALALLGAGIIREVVLQRRRAREINGLDHELEHMLHVPGLGLTMADGGEPLPPSSGGDAGDAGQRK